MSATLRRRQKALFAAAADLLALPSGVWAAAALAGLGASAAFAATDTWQGGNATAPTWDQTSNWSLGAKPGTGDDAVFPLGIPATPGSTITLGTGDNANTLQFNDNYTLGPSGTAAADLTIFGAAGGTNISVAAGSTATISVVLKGTNGLSLVGGGTLILTSTNNAFTGNILINASTLQFVGQGNADPTVLGAGAKTVTLINGGILRPSTSSDTSANNKTYVIGTGGGTFDMASGVTMTLNDANQLSGTGNLTKTGAGTLQIGQSSTGYTNFAGQLIINAGLVQAVGNAGSLGASGSATNNTIINNTAVLDVQAPTTELITINGTNATGSLINSSTNAGGVGAVTLGTNAFIGGAGTLTVGAVGDGGNALGFTKVGNGATIMSAPNTYTGPTFVSAGALRFTSAANVPTTSNITLNGGVLETSFAQTFATGTGQGQVQLPNTAGGFSANGAAVTVNLNGAASPLVWGSTAGFNPSTLILNGPTANNTIDFQNPIDLNGAARTVAGNGAGTNIATISGAITNSGTSGGLIVNGTGIIALTNTNNNYGTTTLTAGELSLAADAPLGAPTNTLVFNGGTLQVTGTNYTNFGARPVTLTANKTIGFDIATAANTFSVGQTFTSGQVLTKTGAGTLLLTNTGTNTVTTLNVNGGVVDIGSGTLVLNNSGASTIQSTTGGTVNATGGGVLKISSNTYPNFGDNGTANGTTLTINAKIVSNGTAASTDGFEVYGGNGVTGVVVLTNQNTFTGDVNVDGGILSVSNIGNAGSTTSNLGAGTNILLSNNASGTLRYTGPGETSNRVITLNGTTTGGVIDQSGTNGLLKFTSNLNPSGAGSKTITFQGSTAGTGEFAGVISDNTATNTTTVSKAGSGTWTLSGTNTYTGETIIGGGILNVATLSDYGVASAIGARTVANENGTTTGIGLHFTGGTLQYTGSTPQSTNRQIRVSTAGGTIDASGTVPSATLSFTGASFGGTNINLFDTAGTRTLNLVGSNTGTNTFGIRLEDQGTNATSLTKNGVGNWVLTATNSTFTGGVTVTQGSLTITNSSALGAGTKTINLNNGSAGNPQLHLNGIAGNITLPSTFTYSTSNNSTATTGAIFNDAGNNTIQGTINPTAGGGDTPIVVNAGTLTIAAGINVTGTGLGTRNVRFRGPGSGTVTGLIGPGNGTNVVGIVQEGAGVWTLTNNNTYTGGNTVTSGALLVNGNNSGVNVSSVSGGTFGGSGTVAGAVTLTGAGQIAPGSALATPGAFTVGSVTFGSNSALLADLAGATPKTQYDQLLTTSTASNSVSLGNAVLSLNVTDPSTLSGTVGNTYTVVDPAGTAANELNGQFGSLVVNGVTETLTGTGPNQQTFADPNGVQPGFVVNYLAGDGNAVVLTSNAVPEPATLGLVLIPAMGLLARRRRNRPTRPATA